MSAKLKNSLFPAKLAFFFGVIFVSIILAIALFVPHPTPFQYTVFRIVLAVAAAAVAAEIPGILKVRIAKCITASGALAAFIIVYSYSPAGLVVQEDIKNVQNHLSLIEQQTAENKSQNDKLLAAVRELSLTLAQASQTGAKEDEQTRLARAYAVLEDKLKLPRGMLEKELPKFAGQLLQRRDTSVMDRASALFALKKFAEAEAAALEAKDKAIATGRPVKDVIAALGLAGSAAEAQIHYPPALEHYRAAAALTSQQRDPIEWAHVQSAIANVLDLDGHYHDAEAIYREVILVDERVLGPDHPDVFESCYNLALCLKAEGKNSEALLLARRACDGLQNSFGEANPHTKSAKKLVENLEQTP